MTREDHDRTTGHTYVEGVRDVMRRWQQSSYILIHAGEMTAQEMRTVLAVLKAVASEVDAYLPKANDFGDAGS